MKRFGFISIAFIIIGFNAFSQGYFNKLYHPSFGYNSIIELSDGYIIYGDVFAPINRELILTKINFKGDTIWQKIIGQAPQVYYSGQIILANDKNIVFTAAIKDSVTAKNIGAILIKVNPINKSILWQRRYGGSGQNIVGQVIQTADGGFILSGTSDSYTTYGNGDFYLIKTDSFGIEQWHKTYGGSKVDECYSMAEAKDRGVILSGYSNSFSSNYKVYVVKVDSLGNEQWEKTYGTNFDNYAGLISTLNDGNYVIASASPGASNKTIANLSKINTKGDIIWQKNYNYGNYSAFNYAPIENNDGTIVLLGTYDPTNMSNDLGYLLKVNYQGDTLWSKTYTPNSGFPAHPSCLIKQSNNGFIFCGFAGDTVNKQRAWAVKIDCMGNDSIHYAKQNGCCNLYAANIFSNKTNYTFCKGDSATLTIQPAYNSYQWSTGATTQSIKVKQGGNYTVTITNSNSCTLGIQPTIVQVDTMPVPVISIKNKDTLQSNYAIGSRWYRNGQLITTAIGPIYATGGVGGTYTVVVSNTCGTGTSQALVVTGINELGSSKFESLKVWPNPVTSGELHIEGLKNDNFIEVYNLLGQRSPTPTLPGGEGMRLDLSGLMKGIYFLKLQSAGKQQVFKIIVQ